MKYMKNIFLRSAAISLSVLMLAQTAVSAISYTGIGEVTDIKRDTVGDGLEYTELTSVNEEGKAQLSYIFEYDPKGDTLPLIRCGGGVYGTKKVGTIVSATVEEGETVLGALNGDFYSMQTGVPLGVMIDGGRLISSDDSKYAFAVTEDSRAIIGKPEIAVTISKSGDGNTVAIDHVNKYPGIWGAYLLDEGFGKTTHSSDIGTEIVIEAYGELVPSGKVSGKILEIRTDVTDGEIPEGCFVLVLADKFSRLSEFSEFAVGDDVEISVSCSEEFADAVTAIGGGDLILAEGVMPEGIIDDAHEKTNNPRTAVGIKADGTVVFFAVDGRTAASHGITEEELAALMSELGCVTALNLDGGGSTTVMVKASDEKDCVYVNVPSDGSYRAVSNGILFVSKSESDGTAAALSVMPKNSIVLTGSRVDFTALVLDKAYMPTELTIDTDDLTADFRDEFKDGDGEVSGGSYIAGTNIGEMRLTLSNGDISGNVSVTVTDKLDSFEVTPKYSRVKSGTLVKLALSGRSDGKNVAVSAGSFHYTLNGTHKVADPESYPGAMLVCDLGYLDFDGNFQSFGGREGTVEIVVSYGELEKTVTVEVNGAPEPVSDFETLSEYGGYTLHSGNSGIYLKPMSSGYGSDFSYAVGADYKDAEEAEIFSLSMRDGAYVAPGAKGICLSLKGLDGDKAVLKLRGEDGEIYTFEYSVTKDHSAQNGWQELAAEIPSELSHMTFYIEDLLTVTASGTASREILLDRVYINYGGKVKFTIDDAEDHWAKESIYALYDMGVIRKDDLDETEDGVLYYPDKSITREEFAKLLVLRFGLDFAAYSQNGVKLDKGTSQAYAPYVNAILAAGLMSGRGTSDDGAVIFDGGAAITREEACKVLGSLIDVEAEELDFADSDDISEWAAEGIAKCAAGGIIGGYEDGTVRPKGAVTKAEFVTMLSRLK